MKMYLIIAPIFQFVISSASLNIFLKPLRSTDQATPSINEENYFV